VAGCDLPEGARGRTHRLELIKFGHIRARRADGRILVEVASVNEYLAGLPAETFAKKSPPQTQTHRDLFAAQGARQMPRTWNDALNQAQQLSDRCDAFEKRHFGRRTEKERRRAAKRDGDDPSSSSTSRQYEVDSYAPEERFELRTGALGKEE
jgi:hypothetical protein